eukprot:SAG25_NODE_471_length_7659_cov_3.676720_5_plen_80_part_00
MPDTMEEEDAAPVVRILHAPPFHIPACTIPLPLLPTIHPSSSGMCTQKGVRRYREGDWGATPQTRSPRSLKRRTRRVCS